MFCPWKGQYIKYWELSTQTQTFEGIKFSPMTQFLNISRHQIFAVYRLKNITFRGFCGLLENQRNPRKFGAAKIWCSKVHTKTQSCGCRVDSTYLCSRFSNLYGLFPIFQIWVATCVFVFDSINHSAANFLLPSASTRHEFCHDLVILISATF